jgi:hypothetical protein
VYQRISRLSSEKTNYSIDRHKKALKMLRCGCANHEIRQSPHPDARCARLNGAGGSSGLAIGSAGSPSPPKLPIPAVTAALLRRRAAFAYGTNALRAKRFSGAAVRRGARRRPPSVKLV